MRNKKEPARKICERCDREMVQPRWANGKLDSLFSDRRFCSLTCAGYRLTEKKASGRKRAQRATPMQKCKRCSQSTNLQRHHIDRNPLNNDPQNIEVLCQPCHVKEHRQDGTWGRGAKGGKKTHQEPLTEWRRAFSALKPLEMDKFRLWQQQHGMF